MRDLVRRAVPVLGLLTLLFLLTAPSAGAVLNWCKTDPIVEIGGKRAHVYVASPQDILAAATGPTAVEITVPVGVSTSLISTDAGFGHGWEVTFVESANLRITNRGIEVRVSTSVPANATLLVVTEVVDGSEVSLASVAGATNTWNSVKVYL